jgi:hypothetical protein
MKFGPTVRGGSERDEPDKSSGNAGGGMSIPGEPGAVKVACPVRRGGVGKHSSAMRLAPTPTRVRRDSHPQRAAECKKTVGFLTLAGSVLNVEMA